MPLTPYGLIVWGPATVIAIAAIVGLSLLGWWWALPVVIVPWLFVLQFFRDPLRTVPTDLPPGAFISPADGRVSAVERVEHHVATDGPAVIVRIFLSVVNVHVNRSPYDAIVVDTKLTPGKFLDARTPESAVQNASNLIRLRTADGDPIGVRQVTGKVARRIVCAAGPGDELRRGEKFGMIRFGSTTELILPRPETVDVRVQVGDRVRGGLTLLATMAPVDAPAELVSGATG